MESRKSRKKFNLEKKKKKPFNLEEKQKHLLGKIFGLPHPSNGIDLLRNCFSNYLYLKDMYIHNLERNWKNYVCIGVKTFPNL